MQWTLPMGQHGYCYGKYRHRVHYACASCSCAVCALLALVWANSTYRVYRVYDIHIVVISIVVYIMLWYFCFLQGFLWFGFCIQQREYHINYSTVELQWYGVRCRFLRTSECYIIYMYLLTCRYMYSTYSLFVMVTDSKKFCSQVSGCHFVGKGKYSG